nr:hypothetical protein [uncultured Albidiferax sp.]
MKELWELFKTIVTTPTGLIALFGLLLLVLGASGGVRYSGWLPIEEAGWRVALGLLGAAFLTLAARKSLAATGQALLSEAEVKALGIKISMPRAGDSVSDRVRVTVVSEKPIPKGYELRVLRGYPRVHGVVPHAKLTTSNDKLEWDAYDFDIGGAKGETRSIEAWLVGPDGAALLATWESNHQSTVVVANREIRRLAGIANLPADERWLPPITTATRDMHKAYSTIVTKA